MQGSKSGGHWLSANRKVDPLQPAYTLPSYRYAENIGPRSITEAMSTREKQWTMPPPERRSRSASKTRDTHSLDYRDVNSGTWHQRFYSSSGTRPQPPDMRDVSNEREKWRSTGPRGTNPLEPTYISVGGKPMPPVATRMPVPGRAYPRAPGEFYALRTDDIDKCFADAFHKKYGMFATRETNRVDDIFGAQHDTKCNPPPVWRASGPYVDPGNRHYPDKMPSKRTNRVDDIEGAQPAASSLSKSVRRYHESMLPPNLPPPPMPTLADADAMVAAG